MNKKIRKYYKQTREDMQVYLRQEISSMIESGEREKNPYLFELLTYQLRNYNAVSSLVDMRVYKHIKLPRSTKQK